MDVFYVTVFYDKSNSNISSYLLIRFIYDISYNVSLITIFLFRSSTQMIINPTPDFKIYPL